MLTLSTHARLSVAILLLLACVTAAWASGATFAITGQGIVLDEAREVTEGGKEQPPRFHAKAAVGKPFTLRRQTGNDAASEREPSGSAGAVNSPASS